MWRVINAAEDYLNGKVLIETKTLTTEEKFRDIMLFLEDEYVIYNERATITEDIVIDDTLHITVITDVEIEIEDGIEYKSPVCFLDSLQDAMEGLFNSLPVYLLEGLHVENTKSLVSECQFELTYKKDNKSYTIS